MRNLITAAALFLAAGAPASAQHAHDAAGSGVPPAALGAVNMRNEGNSAAQRPFLEGLAHLHNFEYRRAVPAFRAAQKADPGFVLAYWGEAMTHNHPLWAEQDLEAGRAVLARLGADAGARRAKVRSPREAMWLDAVEALYGSGSKIERDRAYSAKMQALHQSDPADVDARAFYALSIMGLASAGRDHALYMRAAALLQDAFATHSRHPGILHYLIHSYDDPFHAPLGLKAAQLYGDVARDAPHALHMTSHIFVPLGLWEDSIRANRAAMKATDALLAASGKPPTWCGHYPEWLVYSLLQVERSAEAQEVIQRCQGEALAELNAGSDPSRVGAARSLFNIWALKASRYQVETGELPPTNWIPAGKGGSLGHFWLAYARMHQARAANRTLATASAEIDRIGRATLAALQAERPLDRQTPRWVERAMAQSAILLAFQTGDRKGALADLKKAAEHEESLPAEFGPPPLPKPSWELLGDLLLAEGDRVGAAEAYRRSLAMTPGRAASQRGLASAVD